METTSLKFVVIDDGDGRDLISRTLRRRFPEAAIVEYVDGAQAARLVADEKVAAVILHRAGPLDGEALVEAIREADEDVPILWMSSFDRSASARKAGAARFLNYDEWAIVGKVVEDVLNERAR